MARPFGLIVIGCLTLSTFPAAAQSGPLEKKNISIAVGGSISQMNKAAYVIALNKKFFEQEGLEVTSTAFASGTAALQALVAGGADVAFTPDQPDGATRPLPTEWTGDDTGVGARGMHGKRGQHGDPMTKRDKLPQRLQAGGAVIARAAARLA